MLRGREKSINHIVNWVWGTVHESYWLIGAQSWKSPSNQDLTFASLHIASTVSRAGYGLRRRAVCRLAAFLGNHFYSFILTARVQASSPPCPVFAPFFTPVFTQVGVLAIQVPRRGISSAQALRPRVLENQWVLTDC